MIPLPEVQKLLHESGHTFSLSTLRKWARLGRWGAVMGKRERRYFMRRKLILRAVHRNLFCICCLSRKGLLA